MTTKNCLLCENTSLLDHTDNESKNRKLCERFLTLNCRYFHLNCDVNGLIKADKTIIKESNCANNNNGESDYSYRNAEGYFLCESCELLAQQFCQVYDEWTNLQILYNWKMKEVTKKIVAKVQISDGFNGQPGNFQENGDSKKIFKNQLLLATQTHWTKEFPRLRLKKLSPEDIGHTIPGVNDETGSFLDEQKNKSKTSKGPDLHQKLNIHTSCRKLCNICDKMVTNLNRHKRIHSGEKLYKCGYCEKSFIQKSAMQLHAVVHTGERRYKCDRCGEAFKHPYQLKRHHEVVHVGGGKTSKKNSRSRSSSLKPFKCRYCNGRYTSKSNRHNHEAILHRGSRPHKCAKCSKRYGDVNRLFIHQVRIHKMEHALPKLKLEPGQSTIANERVKKSKPEFRLTKSEARVHLCNICGKWVTNINRHKIIHTGLKPFKCRYCNAGYNQNEARNDHELTHGTPNFKRGRGRPRKQQQTVTDFSSDVAESIKLETCQNLQLVDYPNEVEAEVEDENESIEIGETFVLQQVKIQPHLQEPDSLSLHDDDDHHDHEIQYPLENIDDYTNFIVAD